MEKTIDLNGRKIKLKTNGGILRRYRAWIGRDIVSDMDYIISAMGNMKPNEDIPIDVLTKFEDVAYAMARYADDTVPETADEWLETFETFDIYLVLPEIISMWNGDNKTLSTPKKNNEPQNESSTEQSSSSDA